MNPTCPDCGYLLKLEIHNYKMNRTDKNKRGRSHFYVCHNCKQHWPRSAVISTNTARRGIAPK